MTPLTPAARSRRFGSPDIADEDEIAAGERDEVVDAGSGVTHQVAQVLGRVPRRVHGPELDEPYREGVAMPEQPMPVVRPRQPLVLPLGAAFLRGVHEHSPFSHFAEAREVVRVDVRVDRGDDAKVVAGCLVEVAIDVAFGVDHNGLPRPGTPDQVGELRKFRINDLPDEHAASRRARPSRTHAGQSRDGVPGSRHYGPVEAIVVPAAVGRARPEP